MLPIEMTRDEIIGVKMIQDLLAVYNQTEDSTISLKNWREMSEADKNQTRLAWELNVGVRPAQGR